MGSFGPAAGAHKSCEVLELGSPDTQNSLNLVVGKSRVNPGPIRGKACLERACVLVRHHMCNQERGGGKGVPFGARHRSLGRGFGIMRGCRDAFAITATHRADLFHARRAATGCVSDECVASGSAAFEGVMERHACRTDSEPGKSGKDQNHDGEYSCHGYIVSRLRGVGSTRRCDSIFRVLDREPRTSPPNRAPGRQ